MLQNILTTQWNEAFNSDTQTQALNNLEEGKILHFPRLAFALRAEEQQFLNAQILDRHAKNVSYHPERHRLWGVQRMTDKERQQLKAMLDRFSWHAVGLVQSLFPHYAPHLMVARTSFRPVEIAGRVTSYRKDDKRLHVDAFPSAPNQGKRILRVFCNIHPHMERVWRVGESFERVANTFLDKIKKPLPGSAAALRLLRITKSYRTLYDHYMLHLHDSMKADDRYQQDCDQQEVRFTPGSTWIVQTDHVSHAAMQGQHLLEQTFYLPVTAMVDESQSPLRILESMLQRPLV